MNNYDVGLTTQIPHYSKYHVAENSSVNAILTCYFVLYFFMTKMDVNMLHRLISSTDKPVGIVMTI